MLWLILPKTRKSHPLSKFLRSFFEGKQPKRRFGALLTAILLVSGILVSPASAFETHQEELGALTAAVKIKTKETFNRPLKEFYISQGYWFLHPALDLVAPKGTPVYPLMNGKVEKVEFSGWGYGNQIVINHSNELKSRYAHLSQIKVQEGDEVERETVIGQVGSTGLATGNHLHLEVIDQGRFLNISSYLEF